VSCEIVDKSIKTYLSCKKQRVYMLCTLVRVEVISGANGLLGSEALWEWCIKFTS